MPATQITQSADETTPAASIQRCNIAGDGAQQIGAFELARQPAVVLRHHMEQGIAARLRFANPETVAEPEGQRPTNNDQDPNPRFPG
jgi:hypothetical protein